MSYFNWKTILFAITILFLGVILFKLLDLPEFKDNLALAVKFDDEPFTELYFENSALLPSKIRDNNTHTFQFTVHNLEGHQMNYIYEVYLIQKTGQYLMDKGQVSLDQDQYKTISEKYQLTTFSSPSGFIVAIPNKNQKIDFWVNRI